jgi:predicted nucleic acid-binding protein
MVLIDTSIWIDHFNRTDKTLQNLLNNYEAVIHPYILGELACGNIKNRKEILSLLNDLPSINKISDEEYYLFIDKNRLYGIGLGFVDIHLLASSMLSRCLIYTRDNNLFLTAESLRIAFK